MNDILKTVNKICLPAQLYLGITTLSILALLFQNVGNQHKYCIGHFSTDLQCNNMSIFIGKIVYMFVWTWILQRFCKKGHKQIAWLLVLFPFILMFVLIAIMVFMLSVNSI
mgnify:FL=1